MSERDTFTISSEGPQCPHCGNQITADDGTFYDADRYTEDECDYCGHTFTVQVEHSTQWVCEQIVPPLDLNSTLETVLGLCSQTPS